MGLYDNYVCKRCGEVVSEEDVPSEFECSCRGQFVEAKLCEVCGEVYIPKDEYLCEMCFEENNTFEIAIEIGEIDKTEVEINDFLANVYSASEIEELIINDFKALPKEKQKEYIERYVGEDKIFLADWLQVRNKNADLH